MEGCLSTLENFSNLVQNLEYDIDEILSKYVGDILAYEISSKSKFLHTRAFQLKEDLCEMFADYLKNERKLFVSKQEVSALQAAIEKTTMEIDRLSSKVGLLDAV